MKEVTSTKIPCYHYYAQCEYCNWNAGISYNDEIPKIRSRVIHHVKTTGHTVAIEKASTIKYHLT